MTGLLDLLEDGLAVSRLTRLAVEDRISEQLRERVIARGGLPAQVVTCTACCSVWAGAAALAAGMVWPAGWRALRRLLAASEATTIAANRGWR